MLPLSSYVRAPDQAYQAEFGENEGNKYDNYDDFSKEMASNESGEEVINIDEDDLDGSTSVRKRSSGRPSKKPSKLIAPGSTHAFTSSLERLKHISNARRKPSVSAKMYVPSFEVKPNANTKIFGSRHRTGHLRKDEESATICTLYCKHCVFLYLNYLFCQMLIIIFSYRPILFIFLCS